MSNQQQEAMIIEWFDSTLKQRNLKVNSASERLDIDRGTLTRWAKGHPPKQLHLLEKFARGLRLDVNEVRRINGYPEVDPLESLVAEAAKLEPEPWQDEIRPDQFEGAGGLPEGDVQLITDAVRALIARKRRERGLD
jgi:transcriptional regulator with XRE-family HTH domain